MNADKMFAQKLYEDGELNPEFVVIRTFTKEDLAWLRALAKTGSMTAHKIIKMIEEDITGDGVSFAIMV